MISRKEQHGDSTFVIVSDTGVNHRIKQIPNQDAINFLVIGDDFAMILSDGVGSCVKAELGSKSAVSAVENVFTVIKDRGLQMDPPAIAGWIIQEWTKLLADENPNDCCATLKAAIKIGNNLLLFSIGDGMIAVTSGCMKLCSPMENNLFSNQTMCLHATVEATDFWMSEFELEPYVPYVVFTCSDGVANGIQPGREIDLVSEIETNITKEGLQNELESFLIELSEYSSDDRTVGVVKYERKNEKPDR